MRIISAGKPRIIIFVLLFLAAAINASFALDKDRTSYGRGIYYWKTVFDLSGHEIKMLRDLQVNRIYLRFFDVVYDAGTKQPVPANYVTFKNEPMQRLGCCYDIVPVIFITQETLSLVSDSDIRSLAVNMARMAKSLIEMNRMEQRGPEIQLDYDWTPATKDKYFKLIKDFGDAVNKDRIKTPKFSNYYSISSTLRLHQIKFASQTGVPPVERACLMLYNMKDIKNFSEDPVTFDLKELKKYVSNAKNYPLKPDIVLPVFKSVYIYREDVVNNILTGISREILDDAGKFKKIKNNLYCCLKDFEYNGIDFKTGDKLKIETVTMQGLKDAVKIMEKNMNTGNNIDLFSFDADSIMEVSGEKIDNFNGIFKP